MQKDTYNITVVQFVRDTERFEDAVSARRVRCKNVRIYLTGWLMYHDNQLLTNQHGLSIEATDQVDPVTGKVDEAGIAKLIEASGHHVPASPDIKIAKAFEVYYENRDS